MENKQIKVSDETKILTILEGKALPLRDVEKVVINGILSAPKNFILVRGGNVNLGHILFSKDKMEIKYVENEKDSLGTVITGSLKMNPDLLKFGINLQKEFTPKSLASFLKMNRLFFADKEQNMIIVTALNSFQATITSEIEKSQDTRGNSKQLAEKKVLSNTPTNFTLELPIFIGQKSSKFNVEICIDTTDAGVKCWLESAEFNDLFLSQRNTLIEDEIKEIELIHKFPIIEEN